jgi:hypothetical protein
MFVNVILRAKLAKQIFSFLDLVLLDGSQNSHYSGGYWLYG